VSLGHGPGRARIRKKISGKTKFEVKDKLKELHADLDLGLRKKDDYTVGAGRHAGLA